MKPTPHTRVAFLVLVFALLLFTSAAFGAAGGRFQKADGDPADPTCVGPTEEPGQGEEMCADDEGEDESEPADEGGAGTRPADEERAQACAEAAGVEPVAEGDDAELADEEELTGLDNAIERVLANCLKNPSSPGLVNALEHLSSNRERHEAREAWKAERAALREAAKAERTVAHDQAKAARDEAKEAAGHGNPRAA